MQWQRGTNISKPWTNLSGIRLPTVARNPLDNPIFWREFLKRLTFFDREHDVELIKDFCRTFKVAPENVAARLQAVYMPGVH
jgi:hypothetical protein